jgi:hypothetical protein
MTPGLQTGVLYALTSMQATIVFVGIAVKSLTQAGDILTLGA